MIKIEEYNFRHLQNYGSHTHPKVTNGFPETKCKKNVIALQKNKFGYITQIYI
jgi:hypothetical protein